MIGDPKATLAAVLVTVLASLALGVGSRGLRDYDLALLPYTLGVLFAAYGVAYRSTLWMQRPPTRMFLRRGIRLVTQQPGRVRAAAHVLGAGARNLAAQRFIQPRSTSRWVAHLLFAWGTLLALAVTFPLVFGWIHFETRADDPQWYRVVALGMVVDEFHLRSATRYLMFNLLNVSAVMVIVGASMALRRRLTDGGAIARQQFGQDLLPLLLLIAISATGLLLTFSTHVLDGYGYPVISLVHALVVGGTLVCVPYGKFLHVFQRPLHLAVTLSRSVDQTTPLACCGVCGEGFAGQMQAADLKRVLAELGRDARLPGPVAHYADVCPRCRRKLLGAAQGGLTVLRGAA